MGSSEHDERAAAPLHLQAVAQEGVDPRELAGLRQGDAELDRELAPCRIILVEERHGSLEQADGGAGVAARERAPARRAEPPGGAGSQLAAFLERSELRQVAVRVLEVVAEQLVVLGGSLAGRSLEPVGVAPVEVGAARLQYAPVGDVAEQDVGEAEGLVPREPPAVARDHLLLQERLEAPGERRGVGAVGQGEERAHPERPADHGARLDRVAILGLETVDAGSQQGVDRRRQREQRRAHGGQAGFGALEPALLDEHAHELGDEQRVALRALADPVREVRGDVLVAEQVLHEAPAVVVVERSQRAAARRRGRSRA